MLPCVIPRQRTIRLQWSPGYSPAELLPDRVPLYTTAACMRNGLQQPGIPLAGEDHAPLTAHHWLTPLGGHHSREGR